MTEFRPFVALRPRRDRAGEVAAPPYDVVDVAEARALAAGNPLSFLHVSRPEIDLPDDVDPHGREVHEHGRRALAGLVESDVLRRDDQPGLVVYRQRMPGAEQVGMVGCATVADYLDATIATHERTRPDKQADRALHMSVLQAHDEPVLLMYRGGTAPARAIAAAAQDAMHRNDPLADVVTPDGAQHTLWAVPPDRVDEVVASFAEISRVYVADGHHRSAAAADVAATSTVGETDRFPVVLVPAEQMTILAYNRVVRGVDDRGAGALIEGLNRDFVVEPSGHAVVPTRRLEFGVRACGHWYRITVRPDRVDPDDLVGGLDVSVLERFVLSPLLGVGDQRTDPRIGFVGGGRGNSELERMTAGGGAVAFSLYPTSAEDVMRVSDAGAIMPPKSTWFEPKLASGLFVHEL